MPACNPGQTCPGVNEGGHGAGASFSWKKGGNCCSHGRKPLPPLAVSAETPGADAARSGSSPGPACTGTAACFAQGLFLAGCKCQGPGSAVGLCKCSMRPWLDDHCKNRCCNQGL